jgi:UrcA family protein
MDARKLVCISAAALVGTMLVSATALVAKTQTYRPVVIEKHIDQIRYVSFADLSLTTREGKHTLYHRVGVAVREVCPGVDSDGFGYDIGYCEDFAWDGARPQIRRAIKAARTGTPMLMTAVGITAAPAK